MKLESSAWTLVNGFAAVQIMNFQERFFCWVEFLPSEELSKDEPFNDLIHGLQVDPVCGCQLWRYTVANFFLWRPMQ